MIGNIVMELYKIYICKLIAMELCIKFEKLKLFSR